MTKTTILINTIEKVKEFVSTIYTCPVNADIVTGRYVIDAKSLMGIFSLDVSKPVELHIHDDGTIAEDTLESIKSFIVDDAK